VTPKPLPLKRTTKSLLTQLQLRSDIEDGEDSYDEAPDAHVAYRRPHLVRSTDVFDPDADLPDHIVKRLEAIRALAMQAYREKRA
jgi:hypothetical protein